MASRMASQPAHPTAFPLLRLPHAIPARRLRPRRYAPPARQAEAAARVGEPALEDFEILRLVGQV